MGHRYAEDDEAADIWLNEVGIDPVALHAHRHHGQLLANGRYRAMRSLFRDFL